jgi:hypothetical protein
VVSLGLGPLAGCNSSGDEQAGIGAKEVAAPYPTSTVLVGLTLDWSTHRRHAAGADNWPLTWADDGHQYAAWGDGFGWNGDDDAKSGAGVTRIVGGRDDYRGEDRYASGEMGCGDLCGKSYGMLALGDSLYSWLSPNSNVANLARASLYRSTDGGSTWRPTEVVFDSDDGLGIPFFLQAGQGYGAARDEYVYVYFTELVEPDRWKVQVPGRHSLARVARTSIEDGSAYEFWKGPTGGAGDPVWGSMSDRQPVFEDPNGVMHSSIIYLPEMGRYVLMTSHSAFAEGNLGVFDGPNPWGPWTTVFYTTGWPAGGEIARTSFYWNIAPKWLNDGDMSFVMVFTGIRENDAWNSIEGRFIAPHDEVGTP